MSDLYLRLPNGRYSVADARTIKERASELYSLSMLNRGEELRSPADTRSMLLNIYKMREAEVFVVIFLDNRHRIIAREDMFHGTIDGASVHPREVVKRALLHNAAAVIFAHNHPSGVAEPSRADQTLTERLKSALSLVDIRVIDHIVIGSDLCVSFAERGLI